MIEGFKFFSFIFSNISILVFGYYLLSKVNNQSISLQSPLWFRILYGFAGGLFSLILMNFSVLIDGSVIVDLRLVTVIVNGFFLGGLPAFISGLMIAFGRLIFGNMSDVYTYSFLYVFISCTQLLVAPLIKRLSNAKKLSIIFVSVLLPMIYTIWFILDDTYVLEIVLIIVYMMIGTAICYYLILELNRSKESFLYFEKLSKIDFLTGMPNRYSYDRTIGSLFKQLDQPLIFLFLLDINKFKQINDTYGHDIGDLALKLFSTKLNLQPQLKGHVYRLGGDEFAILLTDLASLEEAEELIKLIHQKVAEIEIGLAESTSFTLSASVGLGSSQKAPSPIELYKMADVSLYQAKMKTQA